jgi:KaiC/GvpD/RAD55 family RecA-like ATPase
VSFEVAPQKLIRDAANFGWDLEALQQQNRLKLLFTSPQVLSTTSLDPPGTELGDLVGCDEPYHNILEEPYEHLAMDRRERWTLS